MAAAIVWEEAVEGRVVERERGRREDECPSTVALDDDEEEEEEEEGEQGVEIGNEDEELMEEIGTEQVLPLLALALAVLVVLAAGWNAIEAEADEEDEEDEGRGSRVGVG